MSAVSGEIPSSANNPRLPLLAAADPPRPLFWQNGQSIGSQQFLVDVDRVRRSLPQCGHILNLCEGRYHFAVAFCAIAVSGQCNLLPPSRAQRAVAEVLAAHPGSMAITDQIDCPDTRWLRVPELGHDDSRILPVPQLSATQTVAIGYTSGSTGQPCAHPKRWGQLLASNARNHEVLVRTLGERYHLVATVPPQHMYGLEMSLLLPLGGQVSVSVAQPFFAADIADRLASVPAPRALVTTPLHLRAMLDAHVPLPVIDAIISATAPMSQALAEEAETATGACVIEMFGSTETCVIAHRHTAREVDWSLHKDVHIQAQPDGALVQAPWLPHDVLLADLVELRAANRFRLCGRQADLLEIAGKRASLEDLSRRLRAIPGVVDGVMLQYEHGDQRGAQRIAALVVAPKLDEASIVDALRQQIDPVFLPRPLRKVARLPRNAIGKLSRQALLDLLDGNAA